MNELRVFTLSMGGHRSPEDGVCLMEAAAMLAGEAHSDEPGCVDLCIAAMGRSLNDYATDEQRQTLLAELPYRVIGTRTDDPTIQRRRLEMFTTWAVHTLWRAGLNQQLQAGGWVAWPTLACQQMLRLLESLPRVPLMAADECWQLDVAEAPCGTGMLICRALTGMQQLSRGFVSRYDLDFVLRLWPHPLTTHNSHRALVVSGTEVLNRMIDLTMPHEPAYVDSRNSILQEVNHGKSDDCAGGASPCRHGLSGGSTAATYDGFAGRT